MQSVGKCILAKVPCSLIFDSLYWYTTTHTYIPTTCTHSHTLTHTPYTLLMDCVSRLAVWTMCYTELTHVHAVIRGNVGNGGSVYNSVGYNYYNGKVECLFVFANELMGK